MIATARVQPADARSIFTGKHEIMNPVAGSLRAVALCPVMVASGVRPER